MYNIYPANLSNHHQPSQKDSMKFFTSATKLILLSYSLRHGSTIRKDWESKCVCETNNSKAHWYYFLWWKSDLTCHVVYLPHQQSSVIILSLQIQIVSWLVVVFSSYLKIRRDVANEVTKAAKREIVCSDTRYDHVVVCLPFGVDKVCLHMHSTMVTCLYMVMNGVWCSFVCTKILEVRITPRFIDYLFHLIS